jgi:para-aminobenzoate synthetase/4-amino-4-deoxychorismate lyase
MLHRILLRDPLAARWLEFTQPVAVLIARDLSEVPTLIGRAEERSAEDGLHAAGFVTFEAAAAFDAALETHAPGRLPPLCLGLFGEPRVVERLDVPAGPVADHDPWRMSQAHTDYVSTIATIKEQIALGNTYQVNYTLRQWSDHVGSAWALFGDVAADAPYAAFIEGDGFSIVSASPELFFELDGERLTCRPMKGTAPRGMTLTDDHASRDRLRESAKDRAENVMIADMMRSDMGRIALPGSVQARSLCAVEKYRTVWQMTSTITAVTRAPLAGIFGALFPCASVTGAPKVSSMKIIRELEDTPREIYTGAIGFIAPRRKARFSVAIRTAWIDNATRAAVYGIGGGIVWDSDADAEYEECLHKAKVLSRAAWAGEFELLETILWSPADGFYLLEEHLQRLADSAEYFGFLLERQALERRFARLAARGTSEPRRVRLRLRKDGRFTIEDAPVPATNSPLRVRLAATPIDAGDPFLYHKTTHRDVYEQALSRAGDCDDVLLWNGKRELTESTIANVVVRLQGRLVTPPVDCGLLAGTLRARLLREGTITEARIGLDALQSAEEIFLVNSVRGWMPCTLVGRLNDGTTTRAG